MALNPFRANITLTNAKSQKMYKQATQGLPESRHFDMKEKVKQLHKNLIDIASNFGWGSIVSGIKVAPNDICNLESLTSITLEELSNMPINNGVSPRIILTTLSLQLQILMSSKHESEQP